MTTISKFTYALAAIEDATWRASTYQEPYAVIELKGDFGVCSFDNLEPYDNILEICTPTKRKALNQVPKDLRDWVKKLVVNAYEIRAARRNSA